MGDAPPRASMLGMLISVLRRQYDTLLRRRRDTRIDPEGIFFNYAGLAMSLIPRMEDDVSVITGRVVISAVLGTVSYMMGIHGFISTDITVVQDVAGRRKVVGTMKIRFSGPRGDDGSGNGGSGASGDVATS